jgi:REP element-mobilizing transposase RayT
MPQSLAKIYVHAVFSTKHRYPFLTDRAIRSEMHAYLGGTCKTLECPVIAVGGVEDHVHVLCVLSKNISAANLVQKIKQSSSKWIKSKGEMLQKFGWQNGYGIFSVSQSQVETVRRYIAGQEQHHRRKTFQNEFRLLLEKYEIEYDEKYVWD